MSLNPNCMLLCIVSVSTNANLIIFIHLSIDSECWCLNVVLLVLLVKSVNIITTENVFNELRPHPFPIPLTALPYTLDVRPHPFPTPKTIHIPYTLGPV